MFRPLFRAILRLNTRVYTVKDEISFTLPYYIYGIAIYIYCCVQPDDGSEKKPKHVAEIR